MICGCNMWGTCYWGVSYSDLLNFIAFYLFLLDADVDLDWRRVYEGNVVQAVQFYRQASWIASADGSSSSVAVPTLSGLTPHRHPSSLQQQTITISLHIWGVELFLLLKNSTLLYVSLWMCILQVLQILGISLAKTRVSFYFLFSSLHGKDRFLNGVSSASRR